MIDKFQKLVFWSITAQSTLTSPTHRFIYLCVQASVRVTHSHTDVKLSYPVPPDLAVESSVLSVYQYTNSNTDSCQHL